MKKIFGIIILFMFITGFQNLNAQYELNFGLQSKQPESELPKSKATFIPPTPKVYQYINGELQKDDEGNFTISKGWEMMEAYKLFEEGNSLWKTSSGNTGWYNATVPGTVLTTLVDQGIYPDPYYSLNNLHIPDTLCRMDWWYRVTFDIPADVLDSEYELLLNGINYKADVWLNGQRLGNIAGAFKRGIFPTKGILKKNGKNILAIHIFPPNNPGIPHEQNKLSFGGNGGVLCLDGPTFISSEGWDWIPGMRDRNIGIWQDVKLVKTNKVKIQDPFVITDLPLPDTSYADLTIKTTLENITGHTQRLTLKGKINNITFSKEITLSRNEKKEVTIDKNEFSQLRMQNPQLWWPNGYGSQYLYNLELSIEQENKILQTKNIRFGVRELSYELMAQSEAKENIRFNYSPTDARDVGKPLFNNKNAVKLENTQYPDIFVPTFEKGAEKYINRITASEEKDNPYLTILINGKRIFCRGGNWGMDDGMKRVSRERLEPYIKLHKEMGFTMVRNWTGETTEELFYTLCDEYGLLVWNDYMMSTQTFNLEPLDHKLFLDNAEDIVRRFRNHPSIAIWCPRNEGYAPVALEDGFQKIIIENDGTRHYHGNSMKLNLRPSGPWHYLVKSMDYLTERSDGFTTELGAPSVPTANTIRKFIAKEDLWPIGDVWYYHDLHIESFDWKDYIRDVNRIGKEESKNIDEFAARAQFKNYILYRNMLEAWNNKMWNHASGILLWMSHPAWPSMTWQTYSYDYETPGSYFGAKKACEPVHIQWNCINNQLQVINTTLASLPSAKVCFGIYDLKGKKLFNKQLKVNIGENSATNCGEMTIPSDIQEELLLVRVVLEDAKGKQISVNDYWINQKDSNDYTKISDIGKAGIKIIEKGTNYKNGILSLKAEVKNTAPDIALTVKLNAREKETGQIILPAYISDGYFNLLPGETRILDVEIPLQEKREIYMSAEGLNIF